jgi:hypothetical protein
MAVLVLSELVYFVLSFLGLELLRKWKERDTSCYRNISKIRGRRRMLPF